MICTLNSDDCTCRFKALGSETRYVCCISVDRCDLCPPREDNIKSLELFSLLNETAAVEADDCNEVGSRR